MKKLIAAIVIATMGASFAADYLVYDYKASIKRVDPQLKKKTVKKVDVVSMKMNVVSDTIQGYVVLPRCKVCLVQNDNTYGINESGQKTGDGVGVEFMAGGAEAKRSVEGYAYLTLKGNKFVDLKKHSKYLIIKAPVQAGAAIFGSETYLTDDVEPDLKAGEPINPKQNTKAWMYLEYDLWASGWKDNVKEQGTDYVLSAGEFIKGYGDTADIYMGFLGAGNYDGDEVKATGFGTAKVVTSRTSSSATLCGGFVPGSEYNCTIVNTISGTLVGNPEYNLPCGKPAMWDVCVQNIFEATNGGETSAGTDGAPSAKENADKTYKVKKVRYQGRDAAVITGTWTLKYNENLSKLDDNKKQAEIIKKINSKATASANVYELLYDPTGNSAYPGFKAKSVSDLILPPRTTEK